MRPPAAPPHVGSLLRNLRHGAGMSQEALAARAGLHRTYIGQLERSERQPTVATVTRILDVLAVSWGQFGRLLDQSRGQTS
ncbi:MAG: helix-turn-helix domain-containing protein [Gemmatimonadota bacterium]|nr:helix-turn-helix domain-containing protein [Gemmatimonadota bacterium]